MSRFLSSSVRAPRLTCASALQAAFRLAAASASANHHRLVRAVAPCRSAALPLLLTLPVMWLARAHAFSAATILLPLCLCRAMTLYAAAKLRLTASLTISTCCARICCSAPFIFAARMPAFARALGRLADVYPARAAPRAATAGVARLARHSGARDELRSAAVLAPAALRACPPASSHTFVGENGGENRRRTDNGRARCGAAAYMTGDIVANYAGLAWLPSLSTRAGGVLL